MVAQNKNVVGYMYKKTKKRKIEKKKNDILPFKKNLMNNKNIPRLLLGSDTKHLICTRLKKKFFLVKLGFGRT